MLAACEQHVYLATGGYATLWFCAILGFCASFQTAAVPNTASGCAVNLGAGNVPAYRRCVTADVSEGAGRKMQLATSLRALNKQLVLRGALLLPSYACTLGPSGWVGFGLPESQASLRQMFGAQVFVAQPAPKAPTGELSAACALCCLPSAPGRPAHAAALAQSLPPQGYAVAPTCVCGASAPVAGASVAAYSLNGTSPYQFYKAPGLLPRGGALRWAALLCALPANFTGRPSCEQASKTLPTPLC